MNNTEYTWRATVREEQDPRRVSFLCLKRSTTAATVLALLWVMGCNSTEEPLEQGSEDISVWPDPTDTRSESGTGTSTATDGTQSDTSTSSEDSPLSDGSPCEENGQCQSNYCDNNVCCAGGECCAVASDCSGSSCVSRECSSSFQCVYTPLICGAEDSADGETCALENRCDGEGSCTAVGACNGPYVEKPGYVCSTGSVSTACWTSCFNSTQCKSGYECRGNECLLPIVANGSPCEVDADCSSGHCESGVCCTVGECCAQPGHCDQSSCVSRFCDANSECAYYDLRPCGVKDTGDGDTCFGDSACDSHGGCHMIGLCTGPYASTGALVCFDGGVSEECRASCHTPSHCNAGFTCDAGQCVPTLPSGSGPCTTNSQCATGYCTHETGLCCESGRCCQDDGDCLGYLCDLVEHRCALTCDKGSGDDDVLCSILGNFHCDGGSCYAQIPNGGPCDEPSDCESSRCDPQTYICCDQGRCCDDPHDCGAYACLESSASCAQTCAPNGHDDDTLCASHHHCDAGLCRPDLLAGQPGCNESSDCASERCSLSTGACCAGSGASGECCATHAQCDDGNPCTLDQCGADFTCAHTALQDGAPCDEGAFCNGFEYCFLGQCQPGEAPCDYLANGCREVSCDEDGKKCTWLAANEGDACSEPLFCLGEPLHCKGGACAFTGNPALPTCPDLDGNPCTSPVCNELQKVCEPEQAVADHTSCNDGNGCNGADECIAGACTHGGNPCNDDQDPCTVDTCVRKGANQYTCSPRTLANDGSPCDLGPCWGSSLCQGGSCIPGRDRPCLDENLCTRESCTESQSGLASCDESALPRSFALSCNTTTSLSDEGVFSREAYAWGACASPNGFAGPEALLTLKLPKAGNVTIEVISRFPQDLRTTLLTVDDPCDPATCVAPQNASGILTRGGLAAGDHVFILEVEERAGLGFVFTAEIAVTCH